MEDPHPAGRYPWEKKAHAPACTHVLSSQDIYQQILSVQDVDAETRKQITNYITISYKICLTFCIFGVAFGLINCSTTVGSCTAVLHLQSRGILPGLMWWTSRRHEVRDFVWAHMWATHVTEEMLPASSHSMPPGSNDTMKLHRRCLLNLMRLVEGDWRQLFRRRLILLHSPKIKSTDFATSLSLAFSIATFARTL